MKRLAAILAFLIVFGVAAYAATVVVPGPMVPVGFCQFTANTSPAVLISSACSSGIPSGAGVALMVVETANIRWRDDATNPTTSAGMLIASGSAPFLYQGDLTAFKVVAVTGSPVVDISFYKIHP